MVRWIAWAKASGVDGAAVAEAEVAAEPERLGRAVGGDGGPCRGDLGDELVAGGGGRSR